MDQRAWRETTAVVSLVFVFVLASACSDNQEPASTGAAKKPSAASGSAPAPTKSTAPTAATTVTAAKEPADESAKLARRGKGVFMSNCIACHNPDPGMDGSLGPAVANSSFELIEARVMRAEYPADYKPKRDSRVMVAMPYLEPDLEALTAYLNP
jgi:mono/diheme cytochrome c family protein